MYDAFGKIVRQIEDADGNKIFRYNSRTHEVELADGRKLPTVDTSTKPKYSTEAETKKDAIKDKESSPKNRVRAILKPLRGKPITNKETGIVATIGSKGVEKMVSNVAVNKSLANGYTEAQHLEAAANIKQLYEDATLTETNPDKGGNPHLASIKRFHCNTTVDGDEASAKITVKENIFDGHKIYSIELEELNKPAELKNRNGTNSSAGSEGSSLSIHIADSRSSEEPSAETISQEERDGKVKYSLDASDNSGESLLQRIRNKLPEWIGGRTDLNERRNKGITRKLSELSGYKVAFGHTGADETIIDDLQKVIRTRHAYDWEKILPAVGKKIAHNLKVSATPEMSNYIADWILTGAPNNTSAEAKAFLVSEPPKKSLFERIGELRRNFKEEFIDDLDPLKRMLTRIKADFGAEIAAKLEAGIDPYKAARLYRGSGGMVDIMIHGKAKDGANVAIREHWHRRHAHNRRHHTHQLEQIAIEDGLRILSDRARKMFRPARHE